MIAANGDAAAARAERSLDRGIARSRRGFHVLRIAQRIALQARGERAQFVRERAFEQGEIAAALAQARTQFAERRAERCDDRGARTLAAQELRIEHERADDGIAPSGGGPERGVVGEAQIAA